MPDSRLFDRVLLGRLPADFPETRRDGACSWPPSTGVFRSSKIVRQVALGAKNQKLYRGSYLGSRTTRNVRMSGVR
jgi:hypothetical protein